MTSTQEKFKFFITFHVKMKWRIVKHSEYDSPRYMCSEKERSAGPVLVSMLSTTLDLKKYWKQYIYPKIRKCLLEDNTSYMEYDAEDLTYYLFNVCIMTEDDFLDDVEAFDTKIAFTFNHT